MRIVTGICWTTERGWLERKVETQAGSVHSTDVSNVAFSVYQSSVLRVGDKNVLLGTYLFPFRRPTTNKTNKENKCTTTGNYYRKIKLGMGPSAREVSILNRAREGPTGKKEIAKMRRESMPLPGVSGLGRQYGQALGWSVLGTLGPHGPWPE